MTDHTTDAILDDQWKLDFSVAKSMRYNAYRRSFWESCDSWGKGLTIISGTAVVVSIMAQSYLVGQLFAFAVATFSVADVILGFSTRKQLHDKLYREFCRLQLDIVGQMHPTERNIVEWKSRRLEIEMEEPGVIGLLERRCAGEEAKARGVPLRESWKLTPRQLFFSQISIFPGVPTGERE